MHPARYTASQPTPTAFTTLQASPEPPLSASLPPVPVDAHPLDTSCFDAAWEVSLPPLSHTLSERRRILKEDGLAKAPTEAEVQKATSIAHTLDLLECRVRVVELLRWQATTMPEAPLHLLPQRLENRALSYSPPLSFIPELASRIVTSGFVGEDTARLCLLRLQHGLLARNPISQFLPLALLGATGVAYCTFHPVAAIGAALATTFALQAHGAATWARNEYSIGYLHETLDTHLALSRGENPTIAQGLAKHFNWERNERYRADGYMVARTLRILDVPSTAIHKAYATTASVDLKNQPLVNLLMNKLETINVTTSGCLAADYLEAKNNGGELANLLDALNSCYFLWGRRSARLSQHKMIELLTKG
jgi:hypothetical protein